MAPYAKRRELITEVMIVFILLNAIGFPGSYRRVIGYSAGMMIEYTSFFMQLYLMISTSGKDFYSMKLIDLKKKYFSIYLFLAVLFIGSMITTSDSVEQIISCIRVTVTAAFAIWVAENIGIEKLLLNLYHAQILFILASIAFPIFFKAYDTRPASYVNDFVGISGVKNVIAEELSFSLIMNTLFVKIQKSEKKDLPRFFWPFFILQVGLLFMTHGTGAIIVAAIPIAYLYIFQKNTWRLNLGATYILGSILFLIVAMTILPIFTPVLEMLGKDATLTGRIPLWNQLLKVMSQRKSLLGYGYGMFWKDHDAITMMNAGFAENTFMANMTSGSHNNLMELYACNGLVGVITFFIAIAGSFGNSKRLSVRNYLFCFSFIFFYMMSGWTERSWSTYEFELLFLFISMTFALEQKPKMTLEKKEKVGSEKIGRYRKRLEMSTGYIAK